MEKETTPVASNITAAEYMIGGLAVQLESLAGTMDMILATHLRILSHLENKSVEELHDEFFAGYKEARKLARMVMMEGPNFRWPVWNDLPSEASRPRKSFVEGNL